jgi:ankyrin repeat protein
MTLVHHFDGEQNNTPVSLDFTSEEDYPVDVGDLPIHKAAAEGQTDALASLLASDGDVDVYNGACTPLHLAIRGHHAEAVRILLSAGANPTLKDYSDTGYNPPFDAIRLAARCGSPNIIASLIDHGVSISAQTLSLAASVNQYEGLRIMIEALGKNSVSNLLRLEGVRAALDQAAYCWHLESVTVLIKQVEGFPNTANSEDRIALGIALLSCVDDNHANCDDRCRWSEMSKGSLPIIEILITAGADVNFEDPVTHITPFWACSSDPYIIRSLLKHGLRMDSRSATGLTPLFDIVRYKESNNYSPGHVLVNAETGLSLLTDFIAAGADVRATDTNMATPLHVTAYRSFAEMLFSHGADLFAKDAQGKTPLHTACQGLCLGVIDFLLAKGALVNEFTVDGQLTPLLLATLGRDRLISSSSSPLEVIKLLVAYGAKVSAVAADGRTALHEAARRSDQQVVRYLLEQGADVHAMTTDGKSALHFACSHYQFKTKVDMITTATLLMDRGADIEAIDSTGATPLRLAFARHLDTHGDTPDLINTLLQRGADRRALDDGGTLICNPLDSRKWFWDDAGFLREEPAPPPKYPPGLWRGGRGRGTGRGRWVYQRVKDAHCA